MDGSQRFWHSRIAPLPSFVRSAFCVRFLFIFSVHQSSHPAENEDEQNPRSNTQLTKLLLANCWEIRSRWRSELPHLMFYANGYIHVTYTSLLYIYIWKFRAANNPLKKTTISFQEGRPQLSPNKLIATLHFRTGVDEDLKPMTDSHDIYDIFAHLNGWRLLGKLV